MMPEGPARGAALDYEKLMGVMRRLAIEAGEKVLLVDDLLATGGTAEAGIKLIDNAAFRDRMLKALYKKAQGPQHTY